MSSNFGVKTNELPEAGEDDLMTTTEGGAPRARMGGERSAGYYQKAGLSGRGVHTLVAIHRPPQSPDEPPFHIRPNGEKGQRGHSDITDERLQTLIEGAATAV